MKRKGFTLIELIIVLIIIGILASIAGPMMGGMKTKSMCSEAAVGLSAVREALRQYRVEYGSYPMVAYCSVNQATSAKFPGLTLRPGAGETPVGSSLDGTYFSQECYSVEPTNQYIMCTPTFSRAVKRTQIINVTPPGGCIFMSISNGKIYQSNFSSSGYDDGGYLLIIE